MTITITVISILAIAALVWLVNRVMSLNVCPICAGVSLTWAWILAGLYTGWLEAESWKLVAAIAMGGSVVGTANQLEKRPAFARATASTLLLWKALFIPTGFVGAYGLTLGWWYVFLAALAVLVLLVAVFFFSRSGNGRASTPVEALEEKMKNCC